MKKIFVTVAEFLENGGKMEDGRQTYMEGGTKYEIFNSVKNSYILKAIATKVYVQIDATPHYV